MESKGTINLSVICPTRHRPRNAIRLVNSLLKNASHDIEILFWLDDDDRDSQKVLVGRKDCRTLIGARNRNLARMFNALAAEAKSETLLIVGDDNVCNTPRWDSMILEEFQADPLRLVYGDDGFQHGKCATFFAVTKAWIRATGILFPEIFPGDYGDVFITSVAKKAGKLKYLPDLKFSHLHWVNHQADMDSTYAEKQKQDEIINAHQIYLGAASLEEKFVAALQVIKT